MKRRVLLVVALIGMVAISGCGKSNSDNAKKSNDANAANVVKWEARQLNEADFLKADGEKIVNKDGKQVVLRGTNSGGWLVQEIWMCPTVQTDNINCQKNIIDTLTERFGKDKADELIDIYEQNFWTEKEFEQCKEVGMNVIRLPFTYMNLLDDNNEIKEAGLNRIKWFVEEAGKRGMYVILDMHGAPGSQSGAHHSGDTTQGAGLFYGDNKESNQKLYVELWTKIAQEFAGNPVVAGYDLLNEPYCDMSENTGKSCWDLYDKAYDSIREVDPDHIIIMEAKWDPQNLPNPATYSWENIMYEYHQYNYDDQRNPQAQLEAMQLKLDLSEYADYKVPVLIGETSFFSNEQSWEKSLNEMNKRNVNWTTWTFKVTGDGRNSWGIYNIQCEDADIENDSYDEIKRKWSNQDDTIENEMVKKEIKKYINGYYK